MRRILLGLGLLTAVSVTAPRAADAHVSVSIGVPGLGFYVGAPVVYAPPPTYYAPPVYYRSYYPRPVYDRPYCHDQGRHRGWYKHGWDDDDRDDD